MRTISSKQLEKILRSHKKWLNGENSVRANFCEVDLRGANLHGADLCGANLRGAKIDMDVFNKICPLCCPETGAFIGWKKADGHIVKLRIPEDALRSSATTNRCRCSKAKILAIENLDGPVADVRRVSSDHDSSFIYEVGETIEVENFDRDRKNECAPGIHFFCTRQEAVEY